MENPRQRKGTEIGSHEPAKGGKKPAGTAPGLPTPSKATYSNRPVYKNPEDMNAVREQNRYRELTANLFTRGFTPTQEHDIDLMKPGTAYMLEPTDTNTDNPYIPSIVMKRAPGHVRIIRPGQTDSMTDTVITKDVYRTDTTKLTADISLINFDDPNKPWKTYTETLLDRFEGEIPGECESNLQGKIFLSNRLEWIKIDAELNPTIKVSDYVERTFTGTFRSTKENFELIGTTCQRQNRPELGCTEDSAHAVSGKFQINEDGLFANLKYNPTDGRTCNGLYRGKIIIGGGEDVVILLKILKFEDSAPETLKSDVLQAHNDVMQDRFVSEGRKKGGCSVHQRHIDAMEHLLPELAKPTTEEIRTREWLQRYQCYSTHDHADPLVKCCAFDTPEAEQLRKGIATESFTATAKTVLVSARLVLNLCKTMTIQHLETTMDEIKANPYIILLSTIYDPRLIPDGPFLRLLTSVMGMIGITIQIPSELTDIFKSEGDDDLPTNQTIDKSWWRWIKDAAVGNKCFNTIREYVEYYVNGFLEAISKFLSFLGDTVKKIFDWIAFHLVQQVCKILDPIGMLDKTKKYIQNIFLVVTLVSSIFMAISGILGYNFAMSLITSLTGIKEELARGNEFRAEGNGMTDGLTATSLAISIAGVCVGKMNGESLDALGKRCRTLMALVAGGTISLCVMKSLFFLLPDVIQRAAIYKYGPESMHRQLEINEWIGKTKEILKNKSLTKVIKTKAYCEVIKQLSQEGLRLKKHIKDPTDRSLVCTLLAQLGSSMALATQYQETPGNRVLPWTIHICGAPGVGKTMTVHKLIRDVAGYKDTDCFSRQSTDEFWSGFMGQDVIIYDEWLINGNIQEKDAEQAKEFMTLSSNQQFRPNLASTDNLNIGIKGTCATPKIVVTMNNTLYNTVYGFPPEALHRRRKHVIYATLAADTKFVEGSETTVDLLAYSKEEVANYSWMRFQILPGELADPARFPKIGYRTLVDLMQKSLERHQLQCELVSGAVGGSMSGERLATEIIEDALRTACGVPEEPIGILDAIAVACGFHNVFEAEGRNSGRTPGQRKAARFHRGKLNQEQLDEIEQRLKSDTATYEEKVRFWEVTGLMYEKGQVIIDGSVVVDTIETAPAPDNETYISAEDATDSESTTEEIQVELPPSSYPQMQVVVSEPVRGQKEIRTDCRMHIGVNPNFMHRHACRAQGCLNQIAHKHPERSHADMFCKNCRRGGGNIYDPEFFYERFPDETYGEAMRRMWKELTARTTEWFDTMDYMIFEMQMHGQDSYIHDPTKTDEENLAEQNKAKAHADGIRQDFTNAGMDKPVTGILKNCFMAALGGVKMACIMMAVGTAWKWITSDKTQQPITFKAEVYRKNEDRSQRRRGKRGFNKGIKDPHGYTGEGQEDCSLTVYLGSHEYKGVALRGRWILSHEHAYRDAKGTVYPKGTPMTIDYRGRRLTDVFDPENLFTDFDNDICMYRLSNPRHQAFPDIVKKKFLSENDLVAIKSVPIVMTTAGGMRYGTARQAHNISYDCGEIQKMLEDAFITNIHTEEGDCGTMCYVSGGDHIGKFLGMHVAGSAIKTVNPRGLLTWVTREAILETIDEPGIPEDEDLDGIKFTGEGRREEFIEEFAQLQKYPNALFAEYLEPDRRVFVNRKTKIKESVLKEYLPFTTTKEPAVLSHDDPRTEYGDPIVKNVLDTLSSEQVTVDNELVDAIYSTMEQNYDRDLEWPVDKRQLTFEEACGGIPRFLSSLTMNTSPGLPLVLFRTKRGKTDYVWFDKDGQLQYRPEFKERVMEHYNNMDKEMENTHVWLGYLKDEIVRPEKITNARTRIIYCGDLVKCVAYKMRFGAILIGFNRGYANTPSAIGINQYSHDMQVVYDYLTQAGFRFIAGDYKSFDKRFVMAFRDAAYKLLGKFALELGNSQTSWDNFVRAETQSPAQIDHIRFQTICNHMSGCFFTSIINGLVNEGYFRYIFARKFPHLIFDDHVRVKVLGDDHILAISPDIEWTGPMIKEQMKELGQEYTNDDKETEIPDYKNFEDITFLGARPRKILGKWTGAALKKTLEECLLWTKDRNMTIDQSATSMIENASQWDHSYFENYKTSVNNALTAVGLPKIEVPHWKELRRIVANRTAATGLPFSAFMAEGVSRTHEWAQGGFKAEGKTEGSTPLGLTILQTEAMTTVSKTTQQLAHLGLNEERYSLNYGCDSLVFRESFTWNTTQTAGEIIKSYDAPFGLLDIGELNNQQNMPFHNNTYWIGDVTLGIQVNGTPFQQGLLCCYFYPLSAIGDTLPLINWGSQEHVTLSPTTSSTTIMTIPFRFPRNVINTYTASVGARESLGQFHIGVWSPLTSVEASDVTVTVYSAFPNSKWTLPRPRPPAPSLWPENANRPGVTSKGTKRRRRFIKGIRVIEPGMPSVLYKDCDFTSEGQGGSKVTNNYTYNIHDVSGTVAAQGQRGDNKGNTQSISAEAEAVIPMDKPILAGSTVPTHCLYPGLARSQGLAPTSHLALHPTELNTQHHQFHDSRETKIDFLLSRRCLLTTFKWTTSLAENATLLEIPLNSFLGIEPQAQFPVSLAVLNAFSLWRGDIEFEILVVGTQYQSGRLRVVFGYGAPTIDTAHLTCYKQQVLDFNGTADRGTVLCTFQQQSQYLRTYSGPATEDPVQNYSLGTLAILVANQLRATTTVSSAVEVMVFFRILNGETVYPRAIPFSSSKGTSYFGTQIISILPAAIEEEEDESDFERIPNRRLKSGKFVAEGTMEEIEPTTTIATTSAEEVPAAGEGVPMTAMEIPLEPQRMCRLIPGAKFEFPVTDVHEVARRGVLISPNGTFKPVKYTFPSGATPGFNRCDVLDDLDIEVRIGVIPYSFWQQFYAAWAGGLQYRILRKSAQSLPIAYFPSGVKTPTIDGAGHTYGLTFAPGIGQTADGLAGSPTNQEFLMHCWSGSAKAQEQLFVTSGVGYIDVTVPYITHFSMTVVAADGEGGDSVTGQTIGQLVWLDKKDDSQNEAQPLPKGTKLYQSVADDFRFHVFRCPINLFAGPFGNTTYPPTHVAPGTYDMCGWEFTIAAPLPEEEEPEIIPPPTRPPVKQAGRC